MKPKRPALQSLQPRVAMAAPTVKTMDGTPGSTPRVRGRALQTIRKRWFSEHPICVHCDKVGRIRPATELDHIVPLFKGGADDDSNRQGLCEPCHKVKTAEDLRR